MCSRRFYITSGLFPCLFLILAMPGTGYAQVRVKGTVYDSVGLIPVPYVSVLTQSGKGTTTDTQGVYTLDVAATDSIWFSYLNKPTRKFAVSDIKTPYAFDISLRIGIPTLPVATVKNRNYKLDSIENRETYAKIFDFETPGLKISSVGPEGAVGVGLDLTELINSFRFRRNRRMQSFQRKLLNDEQEAFIDHRFSKALIRRITQLNNDSIMNDFIELYRPSYLFTSFANDYTFHKYIKDSYTRYARGLYPPPLWREGETSDYPGPYGQYRDL